MWRIAGVAFLTAFGVAIMWNSAAYAVRLELDPSAPAWAHMAAAILLFAHIGGGAVGLISGAAAILTRKGHSLHRASGNVFFVSMFVSYLIGAGVAPFLPQGQRPNFIAGLMALYLLISGWRTARRGQAPAGIGEWAGLTASLVILTMGLAFIRMGQASPTGTVDGSPPEAFFVFAIAGAAAAAGELNMIVRGGLAGAARIARHFWRMCFSLFIAAGSLFLGQPQVFPDWFNASPLPYLLALSPLAAMAAWLVIVRFRKI